jgi:hypothetical protein
MGLSLLLSLGGASAQQSKLPPCPTDPTAFWDSCFGARNDPRGYGHYTGEFKENKYHGQGILVNSFDNPGQFKYSGGFKSGEYHGQGSMSFPGGSWIGEWQNSEFTGKGVMAVSISGTRTIGEWKNFELNGRGVKFNSDGDVTESGQYLRGKLVRSAAVDPAEFGYPRPTATRLALEAAQQRQKELEDRLAQEIRAREQERLRTAELENERRQRSEPDAKIEQRVAAGRKLSHI